MCVCVCVCLCVCVCVYVMCEKPPMSINEVPFIQCLLEWPCANLKCANAMLVTNAF